MVAGTRTHKDGPTSISFGEMRFGKIRIVRTLLSFSYRKAETLLNLPQTDQNLKQSAPPPIKTMNFFAALHDIEPIPQDDGPEPVCSIAYSPEFIQAYDYLRALLKVDERSERALNLTTLCLQLNPANYTVWHFRRRCLVSLSSESEQTPTIDTERIEKDLDFADKLGGTK